MGLWRVLPKAQSGWIELWLRGGGFVNEFEVAVLRHGLGQCLGALMVSELIDATGWLALIVSLVDRPLGNVAAFLGFNHLGTAKEDSAPGLVVLILGLLGVCHMFHFC